MRQAVETDKAAGQGREGLIDIGASFVPDRQAPKSIQPGKGPLDHPAVPSEALDELDPDARDLAQDIALGHEAETARDRIHPVGIAFGRALAPVTARGSNGGNRMDQRFEDHAVVPVRAGLPLSVGFGPVAAFPILPRCWRYAHLSTPNRSARRCRVHRGAVDAISSKRPLPARRAAASRSCRSHNPLPPGDSPKEFGLEHEENSRLTTNRSGMRGRAPLTFDSTPGSNGSRRF
jgi:hypothetical protein